MRYRFAFSLIPALVMSLAVSGCNIFGSEEPEPGSKAEQLQAELDTFLGSGATGTISTQTLLDAAKESRLKANIGVLQITRELSQSSTSGNLTFPYDIVSPAERTEVLDAVRIMDRALALILYASKVAAGGSTKPATGDVPDSQLEQAAGRVTLTTGIDPCGVYTDFLITRLLKVMLDFRTRLDNLQGITPNRVSVVPVVGGYQVRVTGSITQAQADAINGIINWLTDPTTGVLTTQVKPAFHPMELFGCESVLSDIIDMDKVESYIDNVLVWSLRHSYVHAGTN